MKDQLKEAMKAAMKAREKTKLQTIRELLSVIQYAEIASGKEDLDEAETTKLLKSEVKKRQEAKEFEEKAGRTDAIAKLDEEIEVISGFLPSQLSEQQIEEILLKLKGSTPDCNLSIAMKHLKENHDGLYDGKTASSVARKLFG